MLVCASSSVCEKEKEREREKWNCARTRFSLFSLFHLAQSLESHMHVCTYSNGHDWWSDFFKLTFRPSIICDDWILSQPWPLSEREGEEGICNKGQGIISIVQTESVSLWIVKQIRLPSPRNLEKRERERVKWLAKWIQSHLHTRANGKTINQPLKYPLQWYLHSFLWPNESPRPPLLSLSLPILAFLYVNQWTQAHILTTR